MRLPWISREHHREVVDAYKLLVDSLRNEIDSLEKRMETPVAVTVELPKDFAVIQPAVVSSPARRKKKDNPAVPKLDYAEVDERDVNQLRTLVDFHLGPRAETANRWERRQVLQSVIVQIRAAKDAKLRNGLKASEDPLPETQETTNVPQHVKDMIEKAERGE